MRLFSGLGRIAASMASFFGLGVAASVADPVADVGGSGGAPVPASRKVHKQTRNVRALYRDGRRRYEPNGAREVARRLRQKAKIAARHAEAC